MHARCVLPFLLLLALTVRASGADEVQKALAALRSSRTPSQRLAAVKKLGATQSPRAASALARLVAEDPDLEVRVRAAHALGTSRAPNAGALLLERVIRGGPLGVRDAVAWSLAQTPKAGRVLVDALRARGIRSLERGLLYGAMGRFRDEATRLALQDGIRDADPYVAGEALRAFCSREDTKTESLALLGRILAESQDAEVLLPALDIVEASPSPALRPALERLQTFLEPAIQEAADHLLRVLDARASKEPEKKPPEEGKGRYGTPRLPPPIRPPDDVPTRSRHDVVYVIDVTGSTVMTLPGLLARIRREIALLVEEGLNLRVGFVAYRGGHGAKARRGGLEILPLTYDPIRVRTFLDELEPGGVDDRGASVALALRTTLDRMGWRRAARRSARLIADGSCENPGDAIRCAQMHYQADRTRTRVAYVLRTRTRVPHELDRLARAGGTGTVEVME